MHDEPVDLDARRGRAGLIATENRRKTLHDRGAEAGAGTTGDRVEAEPGSEPEATQPVPPAAPLATPLATPLAPPLAEPLASWVKGAAKARYLLLQYARTREGQTPMQARLIEQTLKDLSVLVDAAQETTEKASEEGEE